MRRTALIAALLLAALLLSPCALAESGEELPTRLQTAKQANLRKEPSTRSNLVERVDRGSTVTVLARLDLAGEAWLKVRVNGSGREGYMLEELLEPIPTPSPVPTPSPTPSPSPVPTPSPTPKPTASPSPSPVPTAPPPTEQPYEVETVGRTRVRVNLRNKPAGTRLVELPQNERLRLLGFIELDDDSVWLHVVSESGREGFVMEEYVRQVLPAVLEPVPESEVRQKFPVISRDPLGDIQKIIPFTYTDEELAAYKTLTVGDRSSEVLALRRQLYAKGYYTKPNENTLFTEATADVIRQFQEAVGLEATGIADPQTQAMLFDERTPAKAGSPQEVLYLDNKKDAPLFIQHAEITSYSFFGSVQLSVENRTGGRLTRFGIKVIPNMSNGEYADMAETFAEEIDRQYNIDGLSVGKGGTYSDFNDEREWEDGWTYPHHFQVSHMIYFTGAQVAISWYRSGGRNVYVDDDQMIFVPVGKGVGDLLMHTLPIEVTDAERANSHWEFGIVSRYVLPVYQDYYGLPQGAWLKSVEENSPADDAGLQAGDVIVGVNDLTILGDATLRKARGSIDPGETATITFWRDGAYYTTELMRPENK